MKVYLILSVIWDDCRIECVCSSRQLAEVTVEEFQRINNMNSSETVIEYLIQEWELDQTNLWTVEFVLGKWKAKRGSVSFAHMVPEKLDEGYYLVRVEAETSAEAVLIGKEIISLKFPEVLNGSV